MFQVSTVSIHLCTNRVAFVCGSLGRILSPGKGILMGMVFYFKSAVTFS